MIDRRAMPTCLRILGTVAITAAMSQPLVAQQPAITNTIGMELVLIAPGTMRVGRFQPTCPRPDTSAVRPGANPRVRWTSEDHARCEQLVRRDATPGFVATISRPYYIGRHEVTQAQWKRVMGSNPSVFQGAKVEGSTARHPVDNVTWADAQAFVRRLNALEPRARYRLPTEFEWEYAARAGATEEPSWGTIRESAWQGQVDLGTTHSVGTRKPNAWGLHDMLGNTWEWVSDFYNERLFADPVPPRRGTIRVLKGGSFVSDVKNAIPATHAAGPGSKFDVGFRIVRDVRP